VASASAPSLVERLARTVAEARRGRALHTRGTTYHATLRIADHGEAYGVPLLDQPRAFRALVRLSRGAGLPPGWPDVMGLAVRIFDADGAGANADLLVSTVLGAVPLARHVPFPRRRSHGPYTTVAGYRTARGRRYLAMWPEGDGRFVIAAGSRFGRFRLIGELELDVQAPDDATLAFDPVRCRPAGLLADGVLQRLRAVAYRGSRAGRGGRLDWAEPTSAPRITRPSPRRTEATGGNPFAAP
jgi:hypothetical protein